MLKGIPKILSPELLKVLCEMGHGDRIVIADGNFPAQSMGKDGIVIRMDGHGICEILEAVLKVFPLDTYVEHPLNLMQVMEGDPVETPIWERYKELVKEADERWGSGNRPDRALCLLRGGQKSLCGRGNRRRGAVRQYHAAKGRGSLNAARQSEEMEVSKSYV